MAAQLEFALDNLEAVVAAAEMTFANIVRLNVYTTDVDELFKLFPRVTDRSGTRVMRLPCWGSRTYQHSSW
jgi:enamine deaminase RidA (YjgF/YER057c/UK114 family)